MCITHRNATKCCISHKFALNEYLRSDRYKVHDAKILSSEECSKSFLQTNIEKALSKIMIPTRGKFNVVTTRETSFLATLRIHQ